MALHTLKQPPPPRALPPLSPVRIRRRRPRGRTPPQRPPMMQRHLGSPLPAVVVAPPRQPRCCRPSRTSYAFALPRRSPGRRHPADARQGPPLLVAFRIYPAAFPSARRIAPAALPPSLASGLASPPPPRDSAASPAPPRAPAALLLPLLAPPPLDRARRLLSALPRRAFACAVPLRLSLSALIHRHCSG